MEYIKSASKHLFLTHEIAVAIGNFDGVHIAHQRLIHKTMEFAKTSGMKAAVLTFNPHTAHLFDKFGSPHLIMSYDEKIAELERLGIDIVIEQRFDEEFASMSEEEFLYYYLTRIGTKAIFVGFDFSFSKDKKANHQQLREFGRKTGTFIEIVEPILHLGTKISSTKIRNLLLEGNITVANQLLGRRYYISGVVERGKMLGRSIGIGTANIYIRNRLAPREGVYLTITNLGEQRLRSVSNVGKTSRDKDTPVLETHILDFDEELYDRKIKVEFIQFMRPEIRFGSQKELIETIEKDIQKARSLFGEFNENI